MTRAVFALALLGCSSAPPPNEPLDAGAELPCTTSLDCPSGSECLFSPADGCFAAPHCMTVTTTQCKGEPACACNGTEVVVCTGSPVPIFSLGPCADGGPPPCTSGLACEDCDLAAWSPPTMGRPIPHVGACSQSEIGAFVAACVGSTASDAACTAWKAQASTSCAACVAPVPYSTWFWGPIACPDAQRCDALNVGGCVDLELGTVANEKSQGGAGSCGDLIASARACNEAACGTCSTLSDQSGCATMAAAAECSSYVQAELSNTGLCAVLNGSQRPAAVDRCFPTSDADDASFLGVFCGNGPP